MTGNETRFCVRQEVPNFNHQLSKNWDDRNVGTNYSVSS